MKVGLKLNALAIAKSLKVSQPAVSKALPYLKKQELVNVEKGKESKRFSIELNRDNDFVMGLKRVDNLKMIYESGLANFLEKEFAGATIILFGSYSRGDDNFKSDIDIAIIGRKDKLIDLKKFEKIFEKEINLRSEEHTSELQSHSFISYAVFCLKKKKNINQ